MPIPAPGAPTWPATLPFALSFPSPPLVHGVFVALGTAAAVTVLLHGAARARRLDPALLVVLSAALASGALAAKLSMRGLPARRRRSFVAGPAPRRRQERPGGPRGCLAG